MKDNRLQLWRNHGLNSPPYAIVLNLFRCNIESFGEYDTYVIEHELKNINVREAGERGAILDLVWTSSARKVTAKTRLELRAWMDLSTFPTPTLLILLMWKCGFKQYTATTYAFHGERGIGLL